MARCFRLSLMPNRQIFGLTARRTPSGYEGSDVRWHCVE
jgi:hypothetical protein